MNAEEKLKAFKAEIENRKSRLYSGQLDEFTSCKIRLYDSMLNYLDSLPGESSMTDIVDGPSYKCVRNTETFVAGEIYYSGVDTQGGTWIYDKDGKGWLLGYMSDCFVQFAGVKPRLIEKDELEKAAEQYGKEETILPEGYNDGDIPDYEEWTADAFKAGANWQKEQLMKDAVQGWVFKNDGIWLIRENIPQLTAVLSKYRHDDEIKIIILPSDNK